MIKIGSDLDGVWADFYKGFGILANTIGYNNQVRSTREVPSWDFMYQEFTPIECGHLWDAIEASPTVWQDLPPMALDNKFLFQYLFDRTDFTFITSRRGDPENVKLQSSNWFKKFTGVDVSIDKIIVCRSVEKVNYIRDLKLDYYIDDCPAILEQVSKADIDGLFLYGMDLPYTKSVSRELRIKFVDLVSTYLFDIRRVL